MSGFENNGVRKNKIHSRILLVVVDNSDNSHFQEKIEDAFEVGSQQISLFRSETLVSVIMIAFHPQAILLLKLYVPALGRRLNLLGLLFDL